MSILRLSMHFAPELAPMGCSGGGVQGIANRKVLISERHWSNLLTLLFYCVRQKERCVTAGPAASAQASR